MLRHPDYTRDRIRQFSERLRAQIYSARQPALEILVSPQVDRISRPEAQTLKYRSCKIGETFGPQWATYWFKVKAMVPHDWRGKRVDLNWASHSEATLWVHGRIMQGLNYEPSQWDKASRSDAILIESAKGGEKVEFEIEMACNKLFGQGNAPFPYTTTKPFVLEACELACFDPEAWELYYDFWVLQELEAEQNRPHSDLDKTWAGELLSELNRCVNVLVPEDRTTWPAAKKILKALLSRTNGTRVHELSAIGHAHIDTAWLWPLAETWRKCERTFSSAVAYMDQYPEYKFSCSQAYQYWIIQDRNPDLYARIKSKVNKGQYIPVGGTWIEPDCNIPNGESLIRQFLHGQRFFKKEFGSYCKEFWNPDVFGYNGQLPQIMKLAGINRFLTQKLSWNRFNRPQHHTFTWQGIDGSEVLAHFPPADTYNADASIKLIRENARNYKDHDRSRHSYMLFGYGDGGGGPTKMMLEILRRVKDLQGVPRTQMRTSDDFFTLLEKDCTDRPLVVGELYFEYHRGTYTSQAGVKRGNRHNEFLLQGTEFLSTVALKTKRMKYPAAELERLWKVLLLNQFHDILPGSSITVVYEDAARDHAQIANEGEPIREHALSVLSSERGHPAPVNTTCFERQEVVKKPDGSLAFVKVPSFGIGETRACKDHVKISKNSKGDYVLENEFLTATIAKTGNLLSLVEAGTGRETMAAPGNVFELYDDRPTAYDAWDIDPFHLETKTDCGPARNSKVVTQDALRAEIEFERPIGKKSTLKQTVRLDAHARRLEFHTLVSWQEDKTLLKVAFPVNVRAMNATYEMQFGSVERPTHYSNNFDLAKYEVCGHKWADLSEHGFGVALLTESKFGYSTYGNVMRISLLRSPTTPDPKCDRGNHYFAYAVYPHAGTWQSGGVVAEGYRFNVPILWTPGAADAKSYAHVEDPNLVLDTIKKSEDGDAVIVRLYEAHGARGTAHVKVSLPHKRVTYCNVLEQDQGQATIERGMIEVPYTPYQIISLKLS